MNIKKAVIITCIICLLIMSFISQNQYHIDNCNEEDCEICIIIQMAKMMMNNLLGTIIIILEIFALYYVLSRIKKCEVIIRNKSLLFRKVQLNE